MNVIAQKCFRPLVLRGSSARGRDHRTFFSLLALAPGMTSFASWLKAAVMHAPAALSDSGETSRGATRQEALVARPYSMRHAAAPFRRAFSRGSHPTRAASTKRLAQGRRRQRRHDLRAKHSAGLHAQAGNTISHSCSRGHTCIPRTVRDHCGVMTRCTAWSS